MQGAILIYRDDEVVFANDAARNIHPQQDWSRTVTFDNIFRTAINLGRIDDPTILSDPESHLVYAKMARSRESSFQFRRLYDGMPYDRYHTGLDSEWNAQIWLKVRGSIADAGDTKTLPPELPEQIHQRRALTHMTGLLDRMGVAMAVVTVDGRLIDCSPLMGDHLRAGALFFRDGESSLRCRDEASTTRLRSAVASVARGQLRAALVPVPIADTFLPVAVLSAPSTNGTAIVVVHDVAQAEPLEELLVSAYGLTKSQAEVVVRVSGGETADEIAATLDRPYDTVRRQIATSRAKIAAGRQHALAHIVTRVAGLIGGISPTSRRRTQ